MIRYDKYYNCDICEEEIPEHIKTQLILLGDDDEYWENYFGK